MTGKVYTKEAREAVRCFTGFLFFHVLWLYSEFQQQIRFDFQHACNEDMAGFGYSVVWDGNARTLTVKTSSADVEPVEARLIVPHVGASNNSWATLVIENKTDSDITLFCLVYVNGYGCWVEGKPKDITLKAHYTYHIPVRNGLVYGERSTVEANMYLDNNSKAEFRIVYNGKTYYGECDVNGNTTLKRR